MEDKRVCALCGGEIKEDKIFKVIFSQGVRPKDWEDIFICEKCAGQGDSHAYGRKKGCGCRS